MWHKTIVNSVSLYWLLAVLVYHCRATPPLTRASRDTTTATPTTSDEVIGATSLAAATAAMRFHAKAIAVATATDSKKEVDTDDSGRDGGNGRNSLVDLMLRRSANLLLEDLQQSNGQLINLTRHHDGDIFRTNGIGNCNADTCIGLSSGTASLVRMDPANNDGLGQASAVGSLAGGSNGRLELLTRRLKMQQQQAALLATTSTAAGQLNDEALGGTDESCSCRCLPYLRAYREDLGICVDDIHECILSPFVSGSSSEKIPYVFLPLRGQIIYPSREISFPNIHTPVCAVTGAQYLTSNGWSDLRNPIDTDYPFRMFRDEGRSFLQWLGETELRQKMQGRLIVIHLVCRDMNVALNISQKEHLTPPKNVFTPCVAFRVNGSPVKYTHNVPEVFFQPANSTILASTSDGMTMREYVVIGVCSLLLGLIYVASVFLYLYMKKRKSRERHNSRNSLNNLSNDINYAKNDQVTYGAPFSRVGSIYSASGTDPNSRTNMGNLKEDLGIVKNNPLLQHFPQLGERELNSGFASDISNSNSECEMDDKIKTSALVHPQLGMGINNKSPKINNGVEKTTHDTDEFLQDNECLPSENVAVIEDIISEDKLENLRAMVNGNVRKKLYFNPAYFEPHLLADPPQAAIEFLQKIREVIAMAKYKMATKRYQPSLNIIPEEGALEANTGCLYNVPLQQNLNGKNLGDKRNSIEMWLQSVPNNEAPASAQKTLDRPATTRSPTKIKVGVRADISPPKERPPPPPVQASKSKAEFEHAKALETTNTNCKTLDKQQLDSQQSQLKLLDAGPRKPSSSNAFENFSSYSAPANVYGFAETVGEIYNNPKFNLMDSPAPSIRSHGSSNRSKSLRKRNETLDQIAATSTPTSLNSFDRQHYNMLRNMKSDIIYDSLKREFPTHVTALSGYPLDIPTPDYDSTIEKKIKEIYSSTQSSIPSVPTPDYSSLSRKSLKQFQPDSPIYRRKSPQYLIVDYETDSLERLEPTKRKSSNSSSSPSSDVSSQLSPSLSTALPLEEELEISHTVYDHLGGFRKDCELKKRQANKNLHNVQKHKEMAARIKYDTPFRGSMTIEVEHEPPSDLERTDSDQFEPDTLDRKPKKQSFCNINDWDNLNNHSVSNDPTICQDYNQINSLPDLNQVSPLPSSNKPRTTSFILKSSNSFRNLREIYESPNAMQPNCKWNNQSRSTSSSDQMKLDEGRLLTLEAKHSRRQRGLQTSHTDPVFGVTKAVTNKTTIKISSPPEVRSSILKEQQDDSLSRGHFHRAGNVQSIKNTTALQQHQNSKQHFCSPMEQRKPQLPHSSPALTNNSSSSERQLQYKNDRQYLKAEVKSAVDEDTLSLHSEGTEITGISDTVVNSEFGNSCNNTLSSAISGPTDTHKSNSVINTMHSKHIDADNVEEKLVVDNVLDGLYGKKINSLRNDYSLTKYLNRRKSQQRDEDHNENFKDTSDAETCVTGNLNKTVKDTEPSHFDRLSISSRSNRSSGHLSERTKEMYRNAGVPVGIAYPQRATNTANNNINSNGINNSSVQTVYRCEIEPAQLTAGMQIAIGLKDRAKKAKDLKNAWRKFVTMAASKFSPSQSPAPNYSNKTPTSFLEALDRDEGIVSIIENAATVSTVQEPYVLPTSQNYYEQRFGVRLGELDSGYMSTDSTELYKRNVYDRYNFKNFGVGNHIIGVDTIEDHSEDGIEEGTSNDTILDASRFEDLEHMVSPRSRTITNTRGDISDNDSEKTLTRSNVRGSTTTLSSYSSEDENGRGRSTCYGSSETGEETNAEDMWESGAESIETHSVLYQMIRKS